MVQRSHVKNINPKKAQVEHKIKKLAEKMKTTVPNILLECIENKFCIQNY